MFVWSGCSLGRDLCRIPISFEPSPQQLCLCYRSTGDLWCRSASRMPKVTSRISFYSLMRPSNCPSFSCLLLEFIHWIRGSWRIRHWGRLSLRLCRWQRLEQDTSLFILMSHARLVVDAAAQSAHCSRKKKGDKISPTRRSKCLLDLSPLYQCDQVYYFRAQPASVIKVSLASSPRPIDLFSPVSSTR